MPNGAGVMLTLLVAALWEVLTGKPLDKVPL